MARWMTVVAAAAAIALLPAYPSAAAADGLPVIGFDAGPHGVSTLHKTMRYVATPRHHETAIKAVARSGQTVRSTVLRGTFDVPVVAYDGSSGGLSGDGRTLVLIRPRVAFPQRSTTLAVVDTWTLIARRVEQLRGDFSFDAVSPDGTRVYLIQYTSRTDPTRYRVRALDASTGVLVGRDVVDPRDRGEAMHGSPLARVESRDGRWAYTLYDGNGKPFVHALDTAHARADRKSVV